MYRMLQAVVQNGTGHAAGDLGIPTAGKTGTTNDNHDSWFAGILGDSTILEAIS